MLSELRPLFNTIDKYYNEVNVSLRMEEECLKKIRRSLRVTPDDKRRWEYIHDACKEASALLTSETLPPTPHSPQLINNKAAHNIKTLAQVVSDARKRLLQAHQDIAELTQHPQFGLLRLRSEYTRSENTCRQRINDVLQFSEQFLRSFVQVPPLDDFRDHLLPSAAASSTQILEDVGRKVQSSKYAVLAVLPQLNDDFARFDHCLPIANASMQHTYCALHRLVQPLEQPDDPHQGVFRTMKPTQLREEQRTYADLGRQWGAQS
ncbi:hypothetical protein F5148DRAFT_1191191 [Russula earlei]|uniref:Uncharacterized protein n=1 Tax=Russula earlei TaxID=71964 RepID=A0ACC0UD35_9AGAM|nr:hypothetical protein F5148DRAFT_1191191 [Russula earlei]